MTNCIFYTLFFTLFLNLSIGTLKYSQVHRTFMSIFKGMLEVCTVSVNAAGEPIHPYYESGKVKRYIDNYLKVNLSKYTKDYTVTLTYLNQANSISKCKSSCRVVRINLDAKINTFMTYSNSQFFTIVDGDNL